MRTFPIRKSLFARLLAYFLSISLIPLVAIGAVAGGKLTDAIQADSRKYERLLCTQVSYALDNWLNACEQDSFQYINQDAVQSFLSEKNQSAASYRNFKLSMTKVWAGNADLADVAFCQMNGTLDSLHILTGDKNAKLSPQTGRDSDASAFGALVADTAPNVQWFSASAFQFNEDSSDAAAFRNTVSLCRKVIDINSGDTIGLLVWHFRADAITQQYRDALDANSCVVIVNDRGAVINPYGLLSGVSAFDGSFLSQMTDAEGSFVTDLQSARYSVHYATSAKTGWRIISFMPESVILRPVTETMKVLALVLLLIAAAAVTVSFVYSRSILRPIEKLTRAIEGIDYDNLKPKEILLTEDEIGRLARCFYDMCSRIDLLSRQRQQSSNQLRNAELRALQSQINPHFLYNTLDNIAWLAKAHGENEIVDMLVSFSRFYRISLSNGMAEIPFSMELEHLKRYLELLRVRGESEKYTVEFDVSPETLCVTLQKIILQPLVENAIMHGFRDMERPGRLCVRARIEEECLAVRVIDNGAGFRGAQGAGSPAPGDSFYGYGIANVNARLTQRYGDAYALQYSDTPGGGTTVLVRIPVQKR